MMTVSQFNEYLTKSGLVAEQRVAELMAMAATTPDTTTDAVAWATWLVKRNILTKYQAKRLLEGKWRNFVVNGKYVILDQLGGGGMGVVFKAQHLRLGKPVALKVLKADVKKDPAAVQRFLREARSGAKIDHPNVVKTLDVEEALGQHFLSLEFVEGITLQELVTRDGPLAVERAVDYVIQAAQGLQAAHEAGLVHRDIKPANLLLDNTGVVKLLDLGLARHEADAGDALTEQLDQNQVMGSADYIAPEQALRKGPLDIRADIYSLGGVAFFLLIGEPPFASCNVTQKLLAHQLREPPKLKSIRPNLPTGLCSVVDRMLAKNPAARFATPADVVAALIPWSSSATPEQARAAKARPMNLTVSPMVAAGTIAAVALLGLAALWYSTLPPAHEGYLDSAVAAASRNDWEGAKKSFTQALAATANDPAAREQVIAALLRHERLIAPLAALAPKDAVLQERCGEHYHRKKLWDRAEPYIEAAVKLNPKNVKLWEKRRDIAVALGKWNIATDSLRHMAEANSEVAQPWFEGGITLAATSPSGDDFARHAAQMVARYVNSGRSTIGLFDIAQTGFICALRPDAVKNLEPIATRLRTAMEEQDAATWVKFVLGALYYRMGKFDQARPILEEASADTAWPGHHLAALVLGMLHLKQMRPEEARMLATHVAAWQETHRKNATDQRPYESAKIVWWDWVAIEVLLNELDQQLEDAGHARAKP